MNHRLPFVTLTAVAFGATTIGFGSLLGGCFEYHVTDETAGTAGTGAVPGSGGTGGSAAGSGGAGGAGSGGAGSAGMSGGGTGGAAPTEASCDNVQACGGDLVGKWSVIDTCLAISGELDLSGLGTDCDSAPVQGMLEVTGTLTLTGDGMYTDETTTTGQETIDLPPPCLTLSATMTTCARIGGPLASVGFSRVTCVDNPATSGCTCTATVQQDGGLGSVSPVPATSGSYMVANNVLSISDGIHDLPYGYCVAANTLSTSPPTTTKTGTATGTILLQKQ